MDHSFPARVLETVSVPLPPTRVRAHVQRMCESTGLHRRFPASVELLFLLAGSACLASHSSSVSAAGPGLGEELVERWGVSVS